MNNLMIARRGMMRQVNLYPDPWEDDGKVWVYYDVNDTLTSILYLTSGILKMSVDGGEEETPVTRYSFSTYGEHLIKFTTSSSVSFGSNSNWQGIDSARRIYIPNSFTNISTSVLRNAGVTFVRISPNVTTINAEAFYNCTSLYIDNLSLPQLSGTVGRIAFYHVNIGKISDLGTITQIDFNCFNGSTTLTDVVLPSTLTSIRYGAFSGCTSLERIICHATTPPSLEDGTEFKNAPLSSIKVPASSVQSYKNAPYWSTYSSIINPLT